LGSQQSYEITAENVTLLLMKIMGGQTRVVLGADQLRAI
jgi:hypothetical protein